MHRNRPPPSSKNPHFQNEARCTTFLVKMSFIWRSLNENENDFHRLSSYPRFETKARENSEMAYCVVKFALPCTLCSPHKRNSGFQNLKGLESRIQVRLTKTGIKYLELGIHGVDFRIQDYLRFLYMGRLCSRLCADTISYPVKYEGLSDIVWLSTWEIGALQLRSVTEIAPK